jgi:hypothetical protein
MERFLPTIHFEANEWRVTRADTLLFRSRSERDAQEFVDAYYRPLPGRTTRSSEPESARLS